MAASGPERWRPRRRRRRPTGRPSRSHSTTAGLPAGARSRISATVAVAGRPDGRLGEGGGVDEVQPAPQAGLLDRGRLAPIQRKLPTRSGDEHEGDVRPRAAEQGQGNEPQRKGDHDDPAAPAGGDGALFLASGGFPDGGFDQPAAVQREPGKDVEDADQQVGPDEDVGEDVRHAPEVPAMRPGASRRRRGRSSPPGRPSPPGRSGPVRR